MSGLRRKYRFSGLDGQEEIDLPRVDFLYAQIMELKDWIRSARKMADLTQTQLGEALGVTKGNVSAWENGHHEASYAQLQQIAKLAHIPLPGGEYKHASPGSGAPISAPINGLIKGMPQKSGDNILEGEPKRAIKNVVPAPRDQRHIPVISYVQAGMMTEAVDPFALGDGLETILTDLDLSAQAFALVIEGSSMLPQFNEGDKVIIDPAVPPRPGDFVVAENKAGEVSFMKYRPRGTGEHGEMVFELVPLNDDFPTLHSERDHLRLIGVMIEHRQYRKP